MKGIENFMDIITIVIGMVGAMLKGFKNKLRPVSVIMSMVVAGILCYSVIGIVEIFYHDLTPRLIILIAFVTGWLANEITEKLDLAIGDIYEITIEKLKNTKNEK